MNNEKRTYKQEAQLSLVRGELRKALQFFQKHCAKVPDDFRSRLKMAELLDRLGEKEAAVRGYREVAEAYAREGFLLQAISIMKIIQRIDPSAKEVNARLAQLYTEKTQKAKRFRPLPYIPLFSDLGEEELHSFLDRIESKTFPRETYLCREGEAGDSLMIICRGKVGIYKKNPEGEEMWVRDLGEGDCFGEYGFFIDQKRHADVKALADCEILEISRSELEGIISAFPRVKEVLQDLLRKRVLDLLLALSPLFSSLMLSEREEILKRFRTLDLSKETSVFKGGEPSNCLYMIQNGEVEIFTQNRRGKKVLLGRLGPGHLFGEIGVLFNIPRMAYARTTQPSKLLELSKDDFDALSHRLPKLQSAAREISSRRLLRMREILSGEEVERAKEAMV